MRSLEDRMRPPTVARPWPRDLLWLLFLAALAAVLVPCLHVDWPGLLSSGAGGRDQVRQAQAYEQMVTRVTRRMASAYLPMAMGFLLCLRCGAIDLSVWAVSSLGGVVAAGCILAGLPVWLAFVLGVLAGAGVGGLNALLVAGGRLPGIVATLLTGLAILVCLRASCPQRQIAVPDAAFNGWHIPVPVQLARSLPAPGQGFPHEGAKGGASTSEPAGDASPSEGESQPLYVTRMLLAVGVYSLSMLVLMAFDWVGPKSWDRGGRKALGWALAASGALSAAGGVLWLLDAGAAPVATRPVDDLTVPVAALLAGGAFLAGRGRTLLAGVFLPAALLLSTIWKQEVWLFQRQGYPLQLVLLAFMILLVHAAADDCTTPGRPRRQRPLISCLLAIAGIALIGAGAGATARSGRWVQAAGILAWVLSVVGLLLNRAGLRRPSPPAP